MKTRLVSVFAASAVCLGLVAGCSPSDEKVEYVERGSAFELDTSSGTVTATVGYDKFMTATGSAQEGYTFIFDDGSEKGNLVSIKVSSDEEFAKFDNFLNRIRESLLPKDEKKIYKEGMVEAGDVKGYSWIYANQATEGIGHVTYAFPAGAQDALLVMGTASGDLKRLETVVDTFKFEFHDDKQ